MKYHVVWQIMAGVNSGKTHHFTKSLSICILCLPLVIDGNYFLPTIFWDPTSPALHRAHWSKVVDVKIFQTLIFLCPNNDVSLVPYKATNTRSYYNLYVREIAPNDTNLDYDTICDPGSEKSRYVFSCNQTRNTVLNFKQSESYKKLEINTNQAVSSNPVFKTGKHYIFFSTSNGRQDSLITTSTKCTMVFRINFCAESDKTCALPLCSTFGREEVCVAKSPLSDAPREVQITGNDTTSLSVSWKPPLNTDNPVAYYSICYRTNTSQACQNKMIEADVTTAILSNLNSSTEYFIRVRAVSCKGPGNYSTEISQKTQEQPLTTTEAPQTTTTTPASTMSTSKFTTTIKGLAVLGAPKQVSASKITSSSVTIKWKRPDAIVADVIYYSLCVRNGSLEKECKTTTVESTKLSTVLYNLKANTSYGIRVRAHSCQKPGKYSEQLIIRTNVSDVKLASPSAQKQSGCSGSSIDSVSLVVGIIIGVITALGVIAVLWLVKTKSRREIITQKASLKNITNRGYLSSVSGVNTIDTKNDKNLNCNMELSAFS